MEPNLEGKGHRVGLGSTQVFFQKTNPLSLSSLLFLLSITSTQGRKVRAITGLG